MPQNESSDLGFTILDVGLNSTDKSEVYALRACYAKRDFGLRALAWVPKDESEELKQSQLSNDPKSKIQNPKWELSERRAAIIRRRQCVKVPVR